MTPDDVALVLAQGRRLRRNEAFGSAFYSRIFASAPHLRDMFPADIAAQQKRFAAELDALIFEIDHLAEVSERAGRLGRRHASYGVRPEHYAAVRAALLAAIGTSLGEEWDGYAESAWGAAFDLVADAMQAGAESVG